MSSKIPQIFLKTPLSIAKLVRGQWIHKGNRAVGHIRAHCLQRAWLPHCLKSKWKWCYSEASKQRRVLLLVFKNGICSGVKGECNDPKQSPETRRPDDPVCTHPLPISCLCCVHGSDVFGTSAPKLTLQKLNEHNLSNFLKGNFKFSVWNSSADMTHKLISVLLLRGQHRVWDGEWCKKERTWGEAERLILKVKTAQQVWFDKLATCHVFFLIRYLDLYMMYFESKLNDNNSICIQSLY